MTPKEEIHFDADFVVQRLTEEDKNLRQRLLEKGLSPKMRGPSICDEAESLIGILNEVSGLNLTTEMVRNRADIRNAIYGLLWKMGQEIMAESTGEAVDDFDDKKKSAGPKYPKLVGKRIVLAGIPENEVDDSREFVEYVQSVLDGADRTEERFKHAIQAPLLLDEVFRLFGRVEERVLNRLANQFCYLAFEGKNVVEIVDFVEKKMRPEAKKCGAEKLMDVVCRSAFGNDGENLIQKAYAHFGKDKRAFSEWVISLKQESPKIYSLFSHAVEYLIAVNKPVEA